MSLQNHVELKGLQSEKTRLQGELDTVQREMSDVQGRLARLNQRMKEVNRKIAALAGSEMVVSEHAVLRYIERTMGIDIEALKKEILPDNARHVIRTMGNGTFPVGGTHKVKIQNNTVVTVI